jgi:hypothetical protein
MAFSFRSNLAEAVSELMADYGTHRAKLLANPPSGEGMCLAYRDIVQRVLAERD